MDDPRSDRLRGLAIPLLALLLVVGLVVAAFAMLGRTARERVHDSERYRLDFAAITCEPAPPLPPAEFLPQVQYLADLPTTLNVLDEDLSARLAAAFRLHPWVEKVERVEVKPDRRVVVYLRYRVPVLAVAAADGRRAVDRQGILLPADAKTDDLPRYPGKAPAPAGIAGERWGDAGVEAAARRAAEKLP